MSAHRRQHSYDSKCYDLAEHFLEDAPKAMDLSTLSRFKAELAQEIQDHIEEWLEYDGAYQSALKRYQEQQS